MKKLSVKTIKGLLIASGVATAAVGCTLVVKNNMLKADDSFVVNDVGELKNANVLEEAENQVKEAQAKVEEADKELVEATNAKEEAEEEVKKATEAIEKAENARIEAQAQLNAAKTEEERKAAQDKVKAVEEEIKKAESTKKSAEAKVQAAIENVEKATNAKAEAVDNVKTAEDNKKMVEEQLKKEEEAKTEIVESVQTAAKEEKVEEQLKTSNKNTQQAQQAQQVKQEDEKEEESSKNRSIPQWALDIAAEVERKEKEKQAEIDANNKALAEQAKAQREQEAAQKAADDERARQEREAWEADIKKQSDVVNGYDTYDREFFFTSGPSNAAEEEYIRNLPRSIKSKSNDIVYESGSITVPKSDNLKNGQIWYVEKTCDLKMCEGFTGHFNTAKVSLRLDGARDSVENVVITAPKAKAGYQFVGWKTYTVTYTVNGTNIDIRGFEAVYEPFHN